MDGGQEAYVKKVEGPREEAGDRQEEMKADGVHLTRSEEAPEPRQSWQVPETHLLACSKVLKGQLSLGGRQGRGGHCGLSPCLGVESPFTSPT